MHRSGKGNAVEIYSSWGTPFVVVLEMQLNSRAPSVIAIDGVIVPRWAPVEVEVEVGSRTI